MTHTVKAIELPCTFTRFAPRADKSVTLSFASALEASPELMANLFELHQQEVTLFIATDREAEIRNFKQPKNEKNQTRSQELRLAIYRYWQAQTIAKATTLNFNDFYDAAMAKLIEHYLSKA